MLSFAMEVAMARMYHMHFRMHFQHTTIQIHFCHKQLSAVHFKFSPNKLKKKIVFIHHL